MKPQKELVKLKDEAKAVLTPFVVKTQGEQVLANLLVRLLETLADGKPETPKIERHHT